MNGLESWTWRKNDSFHYECKPLHWFWKIKHDDLENSRMEKNIRESQKLCKHKEFPECEFLSLVTCSHCFKVLRFSENLKNELKMSKSIYRKGIRKYRETLREGFSELPLNSPPTRDTVDAPSNTNSDLYSIGSALIKLSEIL